MKFTQTATAMCSVRCMRDCFARTSMWLCNVYICAVMCVCARVCVSVSRCFLSNAKCMPVSERLRHCIWIRMQATDDRVCVCVSGVRAYLCIGKVVLVVILCFLFSSLLNVRCTCEIVLVRVRDMQSSRNVRSRRPHRHGVQLVASYADSIFVWGLQGLSNVIPQPLRAYSRNAAGRWYAIAFPSFSFYYR